MGVQYRSKYTGKEIDTLLDEVKKLINGNSSFLEFQTRLNFPVVGKVDVLYIATDENKTYYWKDDHYVPIEPDIIYGGGAD